MAHSAAGGAPGHNLAGSVSNRATLAVKSGTLAFKAILLLRMFLTPFFPSPGRIRMVCNSRLDLSGALLRGREHSRSATPGATNGCLPAKVLRAAPIAGCRLKTLAVDKWRVITGPANAGQEQF